MNLEDLLLKFPQLTNLTDFVVNSSIDGIRAVDLNYNYILWNPAFERITGYKKEDVLGKNALEIFPFLRELGEEALFARSVKGETIYVSERKFNIPKTGKKGFFEAVYAPLYDGEQKIIGTFAMVRDVSEFKRTSMALNETELKLQSLNKVVTDGLVTCDQWGKILSWNTGAELIFDFKEEEALKLNLSDILPDFNWKNELRHLRSMGHSERNVRLLGARKNGSGVPVEISKSRWTMGLKVFLSLGLKDLSDFNHLQNQAIEMREIGEALLEVHNDLHQGIVALDIQTNQIVYANTSFSRMIGYTTDELLKLPEDYLKGLRKQLGYTNRGEISEFLKVGLRHKNGDVICVDSAARQIETSYGMISLFILRNNFKVSPQSQLAVLE
jgi:PAS domain S-box-containing protein